MREKQHYKCTTLSFVLINIWTLYVFFDYFVTRHKIFSETGLFIFFVKSIFFCIVLGVTLILLRLFYFKKKRKDKLRANFFYIFAGVFNLYVFIIWLICLFLKLLPADTPLAFYMLGDLTIALFIGFDIYYKK